MALRMKVIYPKNQILADGRSITGSSYLDDIMYVEILRCARL